MFYVLLVAPKETSNWNPRSLSLVSLDVKRSRIEKKFPLYLKNQTSMQSFKKNKNK